MQRKATPEKRGARGPRSLSKKRLQEKAKEIKLLIVDVDGVLTDGSIILDNRGNEFKRFHVRDGHGIKLLQRYGIQVAIITGRRSGVVDRRAEELGIAYVYQRCLDKVIAYEDIKKKLGLDDHEIAYIGDDVVDIPLMKRVGLSVAVADADSHIFEFADLVTSEPGGRGAVRSVSELLLESRGLWKEILDGYVNA